MLVSTVLGARVLGAGDTGTPVWVARHHLAAGLTLRASDVEARAVSVRGSAALYVSAAQPLPTGVVLAREVDRGELLPASAVGPARAGAEQRTVSVPVEGHHAAASLARGDLVDVYVTPGHGDAPVAPVLLATRAVVVDVEDGDGRFGGGTGRGVELAVPAGGVAALVGGLTRGTVDVVRVGSAR